MAGGQGLRMRPLTTNLPKPLLPVVGRPLMAHTLDLLSCHGITDLVVTVQFQAGQIRDYFGDGSDFGVDISYATETQPLGTAGSVKAAESVLRDEPFLVMSGDAMTLVDLTSFTEQHRASGAVLSVLLSPRDDPREFGVAVLAPDGRLERLVEKPGWGDVVSDRVNTGIYCVDPSVLDVIATDRPVDWAQGRDPRPARRRAAGDGPRDRRLLGGRRVAGGLPASAAGCPERPRRAHRPPVSRSGRGLARRGGRDRLRRSRSCRRSTSDPSPASQPAPRSDPPP